MINLPQPKNFYDSHAWFFKPVRVLPYSPLNEPIRKLERICVFDTTNKRLNKL